MRIPAGTSLPTPPRIVWATVVAGIVAICFWVRWWPGSLTAGRDFWRSDENWYFQLACRFLHGRFDVHYFTNPTLDAYLVAAAGAIVGGIRRLLGVDATFALFLARETAAPHLLLWIGRAISITASAISVVVVARIGKRLFSPWVGVIAGFLLAIDGVAARSAPLCGNESLMVMFVLLACCIAFEGDSLRHRLAAGLLLGLATATKYSAGIFLLPLAVAFGRRVGPALLMAAAGFALGSPMALVNFAEFLHGFTRQASFLHAGYFPEDIARHELGFVYYVRAFAATHAGVVFALLCAAGILASIALVAVRRDRSHARLLSASLPLYLYLGTGIFREQRFLLPALPFILIHGAWMAEWLLTRVPGLRSRPHAALAAGLLAIAAVGAPAAVRMRAELRREYDPPESKCLLLADLKTRVPANRRVADLAIPLVYRLLLVTDPWGELGVSPPDEGVRDAVGGALAAEDLLPTSTPLEPLIAASTTLDDLRAKLRDSRIDTVVITFQTRQLLKGLVIRPAPQNTAMLECPYWNELFDWLATMPLVFYGRSPDQRITAAVLDLRK